MGELLKDSTERNVRAQLLSGSFTEVGLKGRFKSYWNTLGFWLKAKEGDITTIRGRRQNGRVGGNVSGVGNIAMYDDTFYQVQKFINFSHFKTCKAISNQIRFIQQYK